MRWLCFTRFFIGSVALFCLHVASQLLAGKEAPFKCRAGARYLYLDEHGLVHWCSQQRQDFEKPLADYSVKDLKDQFYKYKDCSLLCTVGCARTSSAYDEWRRQ